MKPFDLERALAGDPVMTVAGDPVTQLHLFDCDSEIHKLFGVVGGQVTSWTTAGHLLPSGTPHQLDLVMATKKRTVWVNVYPDGYHLGYDTKEEADRRGNKDRIGGKAWPLEIEG